jgi:hypothetical protein
VQKSGGFTTFAISLAPGESAFINLGPYRASAQTPVAAAKDWNGAGILKPKEMKDITLTVVDLHFPITEYC